MRRNFTIIRGFAELDVAGRYIDVHNGYRLTGVRTDPAADTVEIEFQGRTDMSWWIPGSPERFRLVCSGNPRVTFNDLALFLPPAEQGDMEIAYFDLDSRHDWSWMQDETMIGPTGTFGLHLALGGTPTEDFVLRVQCEAVEAVLS